MSSATVAHIRYGQTIEFKACSAVTDEYLIKSYIYMYIRGWVYMGACVCAYRTYRETGATAATFATVYKNQQLNKLSAATGATGVKGSNFPAVLSLARGTRERNFLRAL